MPTYPAQLICRPANLFSAPSNLLEKDSALFSIAETICEESSLSCIKSCSAALLVSHLIYQSSPTQDLQEWIQFPLLEAATLLGWCWKFVFRHNENRSPAYPVLKCHLSNHKKFPKDSQQSSQRAVTACSDCLSLPWELIGRKKWTLGLSFWKYNRLKNELDTLMEAESFRGC